MALGASQASYGGNIWSQPMKSPSLVIGQGNGAAPEIWAIVSIPLLNSLREAGFGYTFKYFISKAIFKLVG